MSFLLYVLQANVRREFIEILGCKKNKEKCDLQTDRESSYVSCKSKGSLISESSVNEVRHISNNEHIESLQQDFE